MKLDNFMVATHQTCPRKYKLRIKEGWTTRRRSAALGFGGAIHLGLADWYRSGGNLESALNAIRAGWDNSGPVDDYRNLGKCLEVMREYTEEYPQESFSVVGYPEVPMVEIPFLIPLVTASGEQVLTDDGTEIEYGGIFDGLVEFGDNAYILEHKSTSQLGDYYFNQFKPNNQVTGYIWGAGQLSGKRVGGAIINAIGVYKKGATKMRRHITSRSDSEIAEWIKNIQASASEIEWHEKRGYWPMRTVSCTMYGKCEYHDVDVLQHEKEREARLSTDYIIEKWDFERRDENETSNGE